MVSSSTPTLLTKKPGDQTMFSFQYTLESHVNLFRSMDADWLFNSANTEEILYLGGIDITKCT